MPMYKISFEEIRIFLEVAKQQHFTKAADSLYIAQPTVTKWIKHLEREVGFKLIHRNSKTVTLTPEGEHLYEKWKVLYESFVGSIDELRAEDPHEKSTLKIGALFGFNFESMFLDPINQFERQFPHVKIDFNIYPFTELQEKAPSLDILLTTNFEAECLKDFLQFQINPIELYLAVSKENPLANRLFVVPKDIENETFFIFSPQTSPTGLKHIHDAFKKHGVFPQLVTVDNIPSQHMKIRRNKGVSITNKHFIKGHEDSIVLIELRDFPLQLFHVCALNQQKGSLVARSFYDFLRATFDPEHLSSVSHHFEMG